MPVGFRNTGHTTPRPGAAGHDRLGAKGMREGREAQDHLSGRWHASTQFRQSEINPSTGNGNRQSATNQRSSPTATVIPTPFDRTFALAMSKRAAGRTRTRTALRSSASARTPRQHRQSVVVPSRLMVRRAAPRLSRLAHPAGQSLQLVDLHQGASSLPLA